MGYVERCVLRLTGISMCVLQVQQLKGVNNLWSEWQLGVREFILIPVSSSDEHCLTNSSVTLNNGGPQPASVSASCEFVTRQQLVARNRLPKIASDGHIVNDSTSTTAPTVCQTNTTSVQDYFSKYDSSLEKIKENVSRMEQSMKWVLLCSFFYIRFMPRCYFGLQLGIHFYWVTGLFYCLLTFCLGITGGKGSFENCEQHLAELRTATKWQCMLSYMCIFRLHCSTMQTQPIVKDKSSVVYLSQSWAIQKQTNRLR